MVWRRHPAEREGKMAMFSPIAVAGLLALAGFFPAPEAAGAGLTEQTVYVVTRVIGDRQNAAAEKRVQGIIMEALSQQGHKVYLGEPAPSAASGAAILNVTAESRLLRGAYTIQAAVGLRASLLDAETRHFIARFDYGPGQPWRIASHCSQTCIDHELYRRVRPLAARLAGDVDGRLIRFNRFRQPAARDRALTSVSFRRIDRSLLPEVEQYLRNFPGVTGIRRDYSASTGVLYHLSGNLTDNTTDLSLRKILHHLQLTARIARDGRTFIVVTDTAAQPAAGSQDW